MALTPKQKALWIIIILAVIVAVILIYIYFFKEEDIEDPNKSNTPVPQGSPTPAWVPESFPLNIGMYGKKILALQKAIGLTGNDLDGKFGTIKTKPALIALGYVVPLSEADYNKIINPPATGGGYNYAILKKALAGGAKDFSGGIYYLAQGKNKNYRFDFYTNGRFVLTEIGATTYLKKGSYSDGGNKMIIDGYGESFQDATPQENIYTIVYTFGK